MIINMIINMIILFDKEILIFCPFKDKYHINYVIMQF